MRDADSPQAATSQTVGAFELWQIVEGCERIGGNRAALCRAAGLDPARVGDLDARLPWRAVPKLFAEAERQTRDPLAGLHAGAAVPARHLLAYLVMAERTLAQALESIRRLSGYAADPWVCELVRGASHSWFRIHWELGGGKDLAHVTEFLVAMMVRQFSQLLAGDFHATEIRFRHAARGAQADYECVLGAPVRFRHGACEIGLSNAVLETRIPTSNPLAVRLLTDQIERRLQVTRAGSFRARTTRVITQMLGRNRADSRDRVARLIGVSARTLQRRLEAEGTSFRKVRDGVLQALAGTLLEDESFSVSAIAERLGFADVDAFGKAFKRWTGKTPSAARRTRIAAAASPGGRR